MILFLLIVTTKIKPSNIDIWLLLKFMFGEIAHFNYLINLL